MPAAAFVVHQLRYSLAYGSRANAELAAQGHSYLSSLVPWTILAFAVSVALFLRRLAHGSGPRATAVPSPVLWLVTFAGLLAIYATQETLESVLSTGHPGGMAGVLGHGGWWAIPVAAVVAGFVTCLLLLGRALLRLGAVAPPHVRATATLRIPSGLAAALPRPLARTAAGRAPPAALPSR